MKTIIAGSRSIVDPYELEYAMSFCDWEITEVVCGMAKGADTLGLRWAGKKDIPVKKFPAAWNKYGNGAGMRRNAEMAEYADALIAVWDGESKGTQNMIKLARNKGLRVLVYCTHLGEIYDYNLRRAAGLS